jgi:broad specificity phosphatase PhoE
MTATVLLIRHGTTQSNMNKVYTALSDEDISSQGRAQIARLSHRLKRERIDAVYSSPLQRTRTVAELVAREHHLDYMIVDDFKEIDFGEWEGRSKEEVQKKWPELWDQLMRDPGKITLPGGESFRAAMERAVDAFEGVVKNNLEKCIAIITHDIIIKMIVLHVLNAPTSIYHHFQVDCSSLSKIIVKNGVGRVMYLNEVFYLDKGEV